MITWKSNQKKKITFDYQRGGSRGGGRIWERIKSMIVLGEFLMVSTFILYRIVLTVQQFKFIDTVDTIIIHDIDWD